MIGTNTDLLVAFNKLQSKKFVDHRPKRHEYRQKHPTGIRWLRCMDSRGDPRFMFGDDLPFGIGRSYQNVGAIFKPKHWPGFQASLQEARSHLEKRGRGTLFVAADHWSKSSPHLGCKGHHNDSARAQAATRILKRQLDELFASESDTVRSICVSIDTDTDAITFRGVNGEVFDIATVVYASPPEIQDRLTAVYGEQLTERMISDLADYAVLNARHCRKVRQKKRPLAEIDRSESMIFVGQSPEALCDRGEALVISPFDPSLSSVVKTAAEILQDNLKKYDLRRGHNLALVAAAPYHPSENMEINAERKNRAGHLARNLAERGWQAINDSVRGIIDHLEPVTGVIRMDTLGFELID